MTRVRLGLAGFGRWGRVLMRNMAAHPRITVAALASRQPDAISAAPAGCRVTPEWRDLLTMDLDGLVVATPPATHAEIGLAAMARGVPLLLEKPLTQSVAEARALTEAAERADALVMVDHIHLFSPAWRRLKEIRSGLGAITGLTGLAGNHGPYRSDTPVLWDWGPHDLAMILDLMGRMPDRCDARRSEWRSVPGGRGETVDLTLGFGAVTARATLSTLMDKTRSFILECEGGTLVYDGIGPVPLTLDGHPVEVAGGTPVEALFDRFAEAVASGGRDRSGLMLGRSVVEVLAACEALLPPAPHGQLP